MIFTREHALGFAIEAAKLSPCQSKRGVAIWNSSGLVSVGWNDQIEPFKCDRSEKCKRSCYKTALHAEQKAILDAGERTRGAFMLHIKVQDGKPVTSMGPSCPECSKLILASGICQMWLFHDHGWMSYTPEKFHWYSVGGGGYLTTKTSHEAIRCSDCLVSEGAQHKPSCHRQGIVSTASDYRDKNLTATLTAEPQITDNSEVK